MRLLALPLLVLLAACSGERETQAPEPVVAPPTQSTQPRTMIAADFVPAELGARIAGMEIADVPVGNRETPFGHASAFVACRSGITTCDPATLPADTRYTYVLTVTPAVPEVPEGAPSPSGSVPAPVPLVMPVAGTLATIAAVPGFDGAVGYSLAEAAAALGAEDAIAVTLEQGRIVWRVREGSRWVPGKPITVWWRSARPPADTKAPAYEFSAGADNARLAAPFPAADKAVEPAPAR